MNNQSSQRVWKEYLILFAFIAILATVLGFCVPVEQANKRDFVFYWMTGHLLTQGLNPYSEQPIPAAAAPDRHSEKAVILYNAPNALWLIIPLGFMNERNANIFWVFIVVASIVISIRLIRALNPQDNDAGLHIAAYGFAPLLLCITAGQMSCFLLLGMVLFLLMHRQHPLLAGIALALCMLKPHVLVPFGVVVGLWIVRERRYSIFGGFVLGCTASSIVPLIFRPTIWRDDSDAVRRGYRTAVLAHTFHASSLDYQSAISVAAVVTNGCGRHMGHMVLLTAQQRLELEQLLCVSTVPCVLVCSTKSLGH